MGASDTALQFAMAQIGKPYKRGGLGPHEYDSAGLIKASFGAAGINLPRTSYQLARYGKEVPSAKHLQPGDLVFSNPVHVGLYVGENRLLISNGPRGVRTILRPVRYWRIRRVTTPGGGAGLSQAQPGIISEGSKRRGS